MQADKTGNARENVVRQLKTYAQYGITTVYSLGEDGELAGPPFNCATSRPAARSIARAFSVGPGHRRRYRRGGARDDRQGRGDQAGPAEDPRRRQPRLRQEDAGGRVARHDRARDRSSSCRSRRTSSISRTRRRCSPAGSNIIAHSVRDVPVDARVRRRMMKSRDACYIPTLMREVSTYRLRLDAVVGERSVLPSKVSGRSADAITAADHRSEATGRDAGQQRLQAGPSLQGAARGREARI